MTLRASRPGMTLLEVIVSMTIFLIALGAIWPLVEMGLNRAREVEEQTLALQKCQSKLSQVMSGDETLGTQEDVAFTDDPDWHWSMEADPQDVANLWKVQVTVWRDTETGKIEVSLTQMVLDPTARGGPAAVPPSTTTGSGTTTGN
jgi:type II secretion system protein I